MNRVPRVRLAAAATLAALTGGLLVAAAPPSSAAPDRTVSFERKAVDSAKSGRVRDLPRQDKVKTQAKERENARFTQPVDTTAAPTQPSAGTSAATTIGGINAQGLGADASLFTVSSAPPDTNGAVGATQYVQSVNTQFAVYDKTTGARIGAPFNGSQLFKNFSGAGSTCATHDDGDPVVQYDKLADRWLLTQFQVTVTPYLECIAVSDTNDATGKYHVYAYGYGTDFVDYPKMGVWPDAYNVTYNVFANGSTFKGGEVCSLDRQAILALTATPGAVVPPAQKCFQLSTAYAGLLASDLDGAAPAAGTDAYVVDMAGGRLNSWRLHSAFSGGTATLTGPTAVSGVTAFTAACSGGGTCIPQPGTQQKLDSLADRLMNRLSYRTVGTTPNLVVTHAITVAGATRKSSSTGVRWYQLQPNGTGLTAAKQGTLAPDSTSRWLSTAAMDKTGAMAVGYSASSSSVFPSIRVASKLYTDTSLGAETVLQAGAGSQAGSNLARWGDYASMSVDPVDDCTLWFTTEYLQTTGAFNWSTRIMSLKTGAC